MRVVAIASAQPLMEHAAKSTAMGHRQLQGTRGIQSDRHIPPHRTDRAPTEYRLDIVNRRFT
jgi:hypothetical protein